MAEQETSQSSQEMASPNPEVSEISELEKLKQESADCKDKYLRLLAEQENSRKRMMKERQELVSFALQNVIIDFLNPIDQMENALKFTDQMSDEVKNWAIGFQMILGQFKDVLTNNGVQPFVSIDTPFDPHLHHAIEMIETEAFQEGYVCEESVKGYKMGDRVIRPAKVKVAKALKQNEIKEEENQ